MTDGAERRGASQSTGGGAGVSPELKGSARDESQQVLPRPANPKKRTDRRPKRAHDAAVARAFFVPAVAACSFRSMFGAVRGYQMASARPGRRRIGAAPRLETEKAARAFLRTFGKARPPQKQANRWPPETRAPPLPSKSRVKIVRGKGRF